LKVSTLESHLGSLMALTHLWVAAETERRAALRPRGTKAGEEDPVAPSTVLARKAIAARSRAVALDPQADPGAKRAAPLLPADVRAMVDKIEQTSLVGIRDKALILLGFAMGRRGAEIAAVNGNDLTEPEEADGEVLRVRVRLSKTNSSGMKEDSVDVPRSQDVRYCPVTAVRCWQLELARRGYTGAALFPRLDNRDRIGAAAGSPARARTADDGRITQQTLYRVIRNAGNCWALAEAAGHARPYRLQHLLSGAIWNEDEVRDRVRGFLARHLGEGGVLIFDETGDLEKGTCTAGTGRQYTGTAGRIENAVVAVYATYATALGHGVVDRELYVQKEWFADPERIAKAGFGPDHAFATKPNSPRRRPNEHSMPGSRRPGPPARRSTDAAANYARCSRPAASATSSPSGATSSSPPPGTRRYTPTRP
jgi:integrase